MFRPPQLPPVKYDALVLKGGLDLATPTLSTPPGVAKDALNFEVSVTGGYSRIRGYERFDGRPAPSAAIAQQLGVAAFLVAPVAGITVNGETSGATGVVAYVGADYAAVTKVVGAFQLGENLRDGVTVLGALTSTGGTQGPRQDAIIDAATADVYRADITAVPGAGAVRGVFYYNDVLYAFRDNAGGTNCLLYMATSGGWVNVPYFYEVPFNTGAGTISDGQVVTQGANTATIKRVVISSGDLQAGTAAGYLVITAPAPGAFAAGAATTPGGTLAMTGASAQITRAIQGRYETVVDNFGGQLATRRVYGVDGVGLAFEFDGTVLVPIRSAVSPDTPKHVAVFKNHLFLAFAGSVLHSGLGKPYDFTAIAGASEIAFGDNLTGLTVSRGEQQGGAMVVYGRNSTNLLYGTSAADWQRVAYGEGSGCIRYSAQYLTEPYVLDDRGVLTLRTSLNYGNFDQATLTANIQSFIVDKRTRVAASLVDRGKSQYRLLFDDGSGLFLTILNGKYLGAMPVQFSHPAFVANNAETSSGDEVSFFGGADGFVYQLERGNSFDGEPLVGNFTLAYYASKSPRMLKQYRHATLEITGQGYAEIAFGYSLGYGSSEYPQAGASSFASAFAPSLWDAFTWDQFFWDGRTLIPTETELRGSAENIAIAVSCGTNYVAPFTINSIILHFSPRRGLR